MMKIKLQHPTRFSQQYALVNAEDFDRVSKHRWYLLDSNKKGKLFYAISRIEGKTTLLHRFILGGQTWDHANGNGLDCRRENLRECTRQQNNFNRKFTKNKTGFHGVYKIRERFQASIRINGRNKSLGYFATAEEAAEARETGAKKLFGKFHRAGAA